MSKDAKIYVLKLLLSLVILSFIFVFLVDFDELLHAAKNIDISMIWLAFLILIPSLWLRSFRWTYLFNDKQHRVSHINGVRLLLVGSALNLFLPSGSGDIIKSYFGYKWTGVKERMLAVSVVDKVVALGSAFLMGVISYIFYYGFAGTLIIILAVSLAASFLYLLVTLRKRLAIYKYIEEWVRRWISIEEVLLHSQTGCGKLLFAVLISFVGWIATYVGLYFCIKATEAQVGMDVVLLVGPLLTFIRLFPFTISGAGTDELAMVVLLGSYSTSPAELILLAALIFRILFVIVPGVCGLFFLNFHEVKKAE